MKKRQILKKAACVFLAGLALVWIPGIAAAVSILDYREAPGFATAPNAAPQPAYYAGRDVACAMTFNDINPGNYPLKPDAACDESIGRGSAGFTLPDSLWRGETDDRQLSANAAAPVPKPTPMILLGIGLIGMAGFRKKFIRQ